MKKILTVVMLCIMAGAVSCGTNVPRETADVTVPATAEPSVTQELSATPEPDAAALLVENLPPGCDYEKLKEAFLERLNYDAWFNPSEMPQTAYECTYEVYMEPKKEGPFGFKEKRFRVGFCCLTVNGVDWYNCGGSYESGEYGCGHSEKIYKTEQMQYLGKDTILVPAVTKPEFEMTAEKEETIEIIKSEAIEIYHNYLEELEFLNKEGKKPKIEVIISDYVPELGYPEAYLIINDRYVDEHLFADGMCSWAFFQRHFLMYPDRDEEFLGISFLTSIDRARLERIKEEALLLDYVYEGEDSDSAQE